MRRRSAEDSAWLVVIAVVALLVSTGCFARVPASTPTPTPTPTATVSAAPSVTPSPTPTPEPFTLLFASDRSGHGGIYRLTGTGTPEHLTTSPAGDWDPTPDPTGQRVAFTSYEASNGDIVVVDADGSNRQRLTTHAADDYWPAWSPDGNRIAFISERDGSQDLYVLDVDACTSSQCRPQRVSADTGLWRHRHPTWSTDGEALIFTGIAVDGVAELYRLALATGELTQLTEWPIKASMPAVAPDGTIAMTTWEDGSVYRLALLEPGAETPRPIFTTSDWVGNLSWTPDGRALLFTMWTETAGSHDVYLLPREGGAPPQRLTTGATWDDFPVAVPAGETGLPTESTPQPVPPPREIPQEWGVNVANLSNTYLIHDLGFTWGKGFVDWSRVEPSPNEYVWIDVDNTVEIFERTGVRTLLRVHNTPSWARPPDTTVSHPPTDTAALADFVDVLARRYRGRVDAYEFWNEPNLAFEWGNEWPEPARYVELLHTVAPALERADPDADLVAGALSVTGAGSDRAIGDLDYLRTFYAAGPGGSYDALSTHPYGFGRPPDTPPAEALGLRRAEEHRALMVEAGDAEVPLWLTEVGWVHEAPAWDLGEHSIGALNPTLQAIYWQDAATYIEHNWPWAETVFVFNLDFSTAPWYDAGEQMRWYALLNPDRSPRPAYSGLRAWRRGYD